MGFMQMTTEYWLQKKTIGGWSMVTSYQDEDQAWRNYISCVGNGMSGYSWRLVEAKTIQEDMLNDVVTIPTDIEMERIGHVRALKQASDVVYSGWSVANPVQDKKSGWGATPTAAWGNLIKSIDPEANGGPSKPDGRGAKPGSICLMHHGLKKRCRAMPEELDMLLSQGWQRGGPRTQFEGE